MELNDFIQHFANQFEDTDSQLFKPNTTFKGLEEWSSLSALMIIAMIDENYDIKIKGDDIRDSGTIEDLFNRVKALK